MTNFSSEKALMTVVAILVAGIVIIAGASFMPPVSATPENNAPSESHIYVD